MTHKKHIRIPAVCMLIVLLLAGCRNTIPESRLVLLEKAGDINPKEAHDSLLALTRDDFSGGDRMYYDFLRVKLADKAIIPHKSDSLIKAVVDYYSRHGSDDRYAEVLYYGGRVYSDLGDYPTALRFYEDALDRTRNISELRLLKGKIVSQTASLLHSIRLFDEARRYIDESIATDRELNDSLNLMYDLELSGINNISRKSYDEAEQDFSDALQIAARIKRTNTAVYSIYLAGVSHYKLNPDSAVIRLKDIPCLADSLFRNDNDYRQLVYSYASDIYRCAEMPDSAYKYALKLIKIPNARNLRKGYSILLSDDLKDVVPQDSIRTYINQYRALTEEYMNSNGDRKALIQDSHYNYSLVERDRQKALEVSRSKERWLAVSVILVLILAAGILYYRYRSNRNRLELHRALEKLGTLREQLDKEREAPQAHEPSGATADDKPTEDPELDLQARLNQELESLCRSRKDRDPLSPLIADSQAYAKLQEHIASLTVIPDKSPLWEQLRTVVSNASPNFDRHLRLLSDSKIKPIDYHILLLVKCGVTPKQLCVLMAKSKATLSYHRKTIGIKWLGNEVDPRLFDNLIYSL